MKIQLDTDKKTIKIEDDIKLSKLVETLDKLLPNKEWKEYTLETNTTIQHWNNPIIIKEYIDRMPYQKPYYPWEPWTVHYSSNNNKQYAMNADQKMLSMQAKSTDGVYNLEIK